MKQFVWQKSKIKLLPIWLLLAMAEQLANGQPLESVEALALNLKVSGSSEGYAAFGELLPDKINSHIFGTQQRMCWAGSFLE